MPHFDIIPYSPHHLPQLPSLLEGAPAYAAADIEDVLDQYPQNARVAMADGHAAAVAANTLKPGDKRASITLFVRPEYRLGGIGSALCRRMLGDIAAAGCTGAVTDYEISQDFAPFLSKFGIRPLFESHYMCYAGDTLPALMDFVPYDDSMYAQTQTLISGAFFQLRQGLGLEPFFMPLSETSRQDMNDRADDYFVLLRQGKIIAAGCVMDNEIDELSVAEEFRGRGIGRALAVHGIDKLKSRGAEVVYLWVVTSNAAALRLYRSLEFKVLRTHRFCVIEF